MAKSFLLLVCVAVGFFAVCDGSIHSRAFMRQGQTAAPKGVTQAPPPPPEDTNTDDQDDVPGGGDDDTAASDGQDYADYGDASDASKDLEDLGLPPVPQDPGSSGDSKPNDNENCFVPCASTTSKTTPEEARAETPTLCEHVCIYFL